MTHAMRGKPPKTGSFTRDTTTEYDVETIEGLKLDNSKSPIVKLSEILKRSNKKDVKYNIISKTNSAYYTIQASNGEITAIGQGLTVSSAKTSAALSLLSQIYYKVNNHVQMPSTFNSMTLNNCFKSKIETKSHDSCNIVTPLSICDFSDPSTSVNEDDEETIFYNNNYDISSTSNKCCTPNPVVKDINEKVFHNNNTNGIMYTPNMCYSPTPESENLAEKNGTMLPEMNYVGLVQEFCMRHQQPLPEYSFTDKSDDKEVIFTAICSLLTFKTTGRGKSKQSAKQCAAYEMSLRIKNLTKVEIDIKPKTCNHESTTEPLMSPKNPSCLQFSSKSLERLDMFLNDFDFSDEIAFEFLNSIAKDEGLSLKYVQIHSKTDAVHILAQLIINNLVFACSGNGKSMIQAQCNAAYTMLLCLKYNIGSHSL